MIGYTSSYLLRLGLFATLLADSSVSSRHLRLLPPACLLVIVQGSGKSRSCEMIFFLYACCLIVDQPEIGRGLARLPAWWFHL